MTFRFRSKRQGIFSAFFAIAVFCCMLACDGLAQDEVSEKRPVPPAVDRNEARKEIESLIPLNAQSRTEQVALAKTLVDTALETKDDWTSRFVLLNLAREQSMSAGDIQAVFETIALIDKEYEFNSDALRVAALREIGNSKGIASKDLDRLREIGMAMVNQFIRDQQYAKASATCDTLQETGKRLRSMPLVKEMETIAVRVDLMAKAYAPVPGALRILQTNADDPAANQTVGQYLAFARGSWNASLTHLAKSSDPQLSKLAQLELQKPSDGKTQLEIADQWLALADTKNTNTLAYTMIKSRAAGWYKRAFGSLTGLAKQKAKVRLEDLTKSGIRPVDPSSPDQDPVLSVSSVAADTSHTTADLPLVFDGIRDARWSRGQTFDLIELFRPQNDIVSGSWSKNGGKLIIAATKDFTRVRFPVIPPDEYDLELDVESRTNKDILNFTLPLPGGSRVGVQIGYQQKSNSHIAGYESIDGKLIHESPLTINQRFLQPGKRTKIRIAVRRQSVITSVNDKPIIRYIGDLKGFNSYPNWESKAKLAVVFGCHAGSSFMVHEAKIRPVASSAKIPSQRPEYFRSPELRGVSAKFDSHEQVFVDDLPVASFRVSIGTLGLKGQIRSLRTDNVILPKIIHEGKEVAHAVSLHPWQDGSCTVVYNLEGKFKTFEALVGCIRSKSGYVNADHKIKGTIYFRIFGDGRLLSDITGAKVRGAMKTLKADVTGVKTLTLVTHCRGNSWSTWSGWLNPVLTK